jgi:hypothetical protein
VVGSQTAMSDQDQSRIVKNTPEMSGYGHIASNDEDDMAQLLRGVDCLTIATQKPEFYGGSSSNVIVNAIEVAEQVEGELPASPVYKSENRVNVWHRGGTRELSFSKVGGATALPKDIADQYINQYIHSVHRLHPILEMTHFMSRCQDFWNSLPTEGKGYELWAAVMYMVLALGHQASTVDPDPRVRKQALGVPHGEACFQLARLALANVPFDGGDISAVNSFLLGVSPRQSPREIS